MHNDDDISFAKAKAALEPPLTQPWAERLAFTIMVTFLFVLVAYIFNESQTPKYVVTHKMPVSVQAIQNNQSMHSLSYLDQLALIEDHVKALSSHSLKELLIQNSEFSNTVRYEKNTPDLYERLNHNLKISFDPQTDSLTIQMADQTPLLAQKAVQLLPQLYLSQLGQSLVSLNHAGLILQFTPQNEFPTFIFPEKLKHIEWAVLTGLITSLLILALTAWLKSAFSSEENLPSKSSFQSFPNQHIYQLPKRRTQA